MRVRSISVGDDGMPETITVEMSAREAAWVGRLTGRQSPDTVRELLPGADFSAENANVYDCLSGEVFNRYYYDGLRDAIRDLA